MLKQNWHGQRSSRPPWRMMRRFSRFVTHRRQACARHLRRRTVDLGRRCFGPGRVERRLGIAERLARCLEDPRAPERVQHGLAEMIRFRALLIAAGYEDANDCDALRADPAFKMAVGRLPERDADLCSQPTMCRLENLPGPIALKRMMAAMVELFCDSFDDVPRRLVLDIDDTEDRVHGGQQLSLFHAYYDSRCFLPIHIYEAITGKPVAVILRPGKTPGGAEVALVLRHVVKAIRPLAPGRYPGARRQPLRPARGDHPCERNRVGYLFGLAGNQILLARSPIWPRTRRSAGSRARPTKRAASANSPMLPRPGRSSAGSSPASRPRPRAATAASSSPTSKARALALRERLLPRGQAENLIKAHKLHLASDRTSCTKATANQFRLLIHTAAYWLLHTLRGLAPKTSFWRDAQFDTLRLALIKVAARVTELKTRIKVALPTCYPHQQSWVLLAGRAAKLRPDPRGSVPRPSPSPPTPKPYHPRPRRHPHPCPKTGAPKPHE